MTLLSAPPYGPGALPRPRPTTARTTFWIDRRTFVFGGGASPPLQNIQASSDIRCIMPARSTRSLRTLLTLAHGSASHTA